MIVNELVTRITLDPKKAMRQFDTFTNSTVRKLNSTAGNMRGAFGSAASRAASLWGSAMSRMASASAKMANKSVMHAQKASNAYSKAFASFKSPLALLGGGLAIGAIGKGILDAGIELEGMKAALVTAMGSDKAADKAFSRIEAFAKKTPYDLKQVGNAFVQLKNLGLDPSERALTAYGNTASAMNKPLSQMVEAVADATTGEFERLKEFGIKAKKDGDFVALTFRGVTKTLKNDSKSIEQYLMQLGEVQFAGGMDRQAKTIGGMLSTLGDNFGAMGRAIWTSGVGDEAKKFTDWMTKQTDVIIAWAQKELPALTKQLVKMGKDGFGFLIKHGPKILAVLGGVAAHFVGVKAILAGRWLITAVQTIRAITLGSAAMSAATLAIPIAIGAAIGAVAYLGYKVYQYFRDGESAVEGLRSKFPPLADLIVYLGEKFKEMRPSLIEAWKHISYIGGVALKILGTVAKWVFENIIIPYMQKWVDSIITVGEWLSKAYDYWMPKLVTSFYYWRDSIADVKDNFVNFFNYLRQEFPWLMGIVDKLAEATGLMGGNSVVDVGSVGASQRPSGSILAAAKAFAVGAPGQSGADKWAKSNDRINGMSVKQLYIKGVACDITAEKVLSDAGASKQVLDAMVGRVPDTYRNLVTRGLAEKVDPKNLKGGELFYAPGMTHTGIVGEGGKTLLHAANSQGSKIGMGQRFSSTSNYLGDRGMYLRIKDNQMNGGGGPVIQQNITVGAGANTGAVKTAAKQGAAQAITSAGLNNQQRVTPQ